MRITVSAVILALTCVAVPASMLATPDSALAMGDGEGKGKGKGKGKDHDEDEGKGEGKGKGKGKNAVIKWSGAGQRLHFSFGGQIEHSLETDQLKGKFTIVVHPLAPPGETVSVVCRYFKFSNATLVDDTLEFDAKGKCTTLGLDGALTTRWVDNHFTLIDNAGGADAIDVDIIGSTGIAVPGGALEYGDFNRMVIKPNPN